MHEPNINKPMCFEFVQVLTFLYKDLVYISYRKMWKENFQLPNENI